MQVLQNAKFLSSLYPLMLFEPKRLKWSLHSLFLKARATGCWGLQMSGLDNAVVDAAVLYIQMGLHNHACQHLDCSHVFLNRFDC